MVIMECGPNLLYGFNSAHRVFFHAFCHLSTSSNISFRNTIGVSNSLNPETDSLSVGSDQDPNFLQRL